MTLSNPMKRLPPTESTQEAADRIGNSPPTVRQLIAEGELCGIRIGRNIRVLSDSVDAFISRLQWNSYVDGFYTPASCEAFEAEMLKNGTIDSEILENLKKAENPKKPGRQ